MDLSIDTSTRYAGVGLTEGSTILKECYWRSGANHSVELASTVARLVEEAGKSVHDLQAIMVASGPGGFSALRVGLSFAKGLAESLDLPLIGVPTLEIEAAKHFDAAQTPLCPLMEVGRDRVAWCLYERTPTGWHCSLDPRVTTSEAMVAAVPTGSAFCGEGAWLSSMRLHELAGPNATVIAERPPTRRLTVLAALGRDRVSQGLGDDRTTLEPNYLRPPSITMPRQKPEESPSP